MIKNIFLGLAMMCVVGVGFRATEVSALTVDEVQAQMRTLMNQVSELTARIAALRTQIVSSGTSESIASIQSAPQSHRICGLMNRNLSNGARGDDVRGLQEFLYGQKLLTAEPTGYFGPKTAEAVRVWQKQEGVSSVGTVGPMSRERIKLWCGNEGTTGNHERFTVSSTRGNAPLTVVFGTWISGFRVPNVYYVIRFGDGVEERAAHCYAPADACLSQGENKHTYTANGTYSATLHKITDPCPDDGDPATPRCLAAVQSEIVGKQEITVGPLACTKEYKPVCGAQPIVCITTPCNPIPTTYSNRCTMNADNASFLYDGQCQSENPADNPQCKAWFDGCNSCSRGAYGEQAACTLRYCAPETMAKSHCSAYFETVGNKPPTISRLSGPTTLIEGGVGTWEIVAADPEGGTLSYQIWWGDENVYASNMNTAASVREFTQTTTFTHVYAEAGTYTVRVTVRDNAGQEVKTTATVRVDGGSTACAEIYQPVCGRPIGCANSCAPGMYCAALCQLYSPVTYPNRCDMERAQASSIHDGQCTSTSGNWY